MIVQIKQTLSCGARTLPMYVQRLLLRGQTLVNMRLVHFWVRVRRQYYCTISIDLNNQ
jgi:hypothetical protein